MDTVIWGRQGAKVKMVLRAVSKRLQGRQTCSASNNNNTTNVLNRARVHRSWCDTRTLSHLHKRHTHTHTYTCQKRRKNYFKLLSLVLLLSRSEFLSQFEVTHTHIHIRMAHGHKHQHASALYGFRFDFLSSNNTPPLMPRACLFVSWRFWDFSPFFFKERHYNVLNSLPPLRCSAKHVYFFKLKR